MCVESTIDFYKVQPIMLEVSKGRTKKWISLRSLGSVGMNILPASCRPRRPSRARAASAVVVGSAVPPARRIVASTMLIAHAGTNIGCKIVRSSHERTRKFRSLCSVKAVRHRRTALSFQSSQRHTVSTFSYTH